ncbi:DUF2293 domain-containing protein [Bartonella sp. DGB2]|uniref:DUF2293 domain-containing protein n=1 Tax=Bartonella sp. DGB2 TaxID=3388426 RepID=UPI00398FB2C0
MESPLPRKKQIAKALRALAPLVPYYDAQGICALALRPHMRNLSPERAIWLATLAYLRHRYSDYDQLRDASYGKEASRFFIRAQINDVLIRWQSVRFLSDDEQ